MTPNPSSFEQNVSALKSQSAKLSYTLLLILFDLFFELLVQAYESTPLQ